MVGSCFGPRVAQRFHVIATVAASSKIAEGQAR